MTEHGRLNAPEPISILISAMGGQGGGVLAEWIVAAAAAQDFPVQSTSIPGVAQRTGATTYYIEIYPVRSSELGDRTPVLALYPIPGRVDLVLAMELIEAGRAMENGFVSPHRTTLIASSHREYAISEKSSMGDGRFDSEKVLRAADKIAHRALVFDLAEVAKRCDSTLNAVFLGAVSGSGCVPVPAESFERGIREKGVAVESNLRGFAEGFAEVQRLPESPAVPQTGTDSLLEPGIPLLPELENRQLNELFPDVVRNMVREGMSHLVDYQGSLYAQLYVERLKVVCAAEQSGFGDARGYALTRETARHLAAWMGYEDAIRVADLKSRQSRRERIRGEFGANVTDPIRITEFLSPGIEEICAILPPLIAKPILKWAERHPRVANFRRSMHVRSDTITGFLKLLFLARLKPLRPRTHRYAEEQKRIQRWLDALPKLVERDYDSALQTAECARLLKGYGDTFRRGHRNFDSIFQTLIEPALNRLGPMPGLAESVRKAREAAQADPEGKSLAGVLEKEGRPSSMSAAVTPAG